MNAKKKVQPAVLVPSLTAFFMFLATAWHVRFCAAVKTEGGEESVGILNIRMSFFFFFFILLLP